MRFGDVTLEVIHTPGHTPGHVVFYQAPRRAWRSSATCCSRDRSGAPIFRAATTPTLIASITRKLWPLGDDVAFVPGHGPMSTFGEERESNAFVADSVLGSAV